MRVFKNNAFIILLVSLFFFSFVFFKFFPSKEKQPYLKILTYSSFSGVYGPGRRLQTLFEAYCHCRIQWILVEDSTRILQRLKLKIPVDVALGFDQITIREFKNENWKLLNLKPYSLIPEMLSHKTKHFIPIDWSPIGFIYRNSKTRLVQSLKKDLFLAEKISLPEPRTSTLGLQFYYWIYSSFSGDISLIKNFLEELKKKIYGPISSWSLSYGFFQKGHVDMSLSYLTSLAYHSEKSTAYQFSYSEQGHPYQVELAGIPDSCSNCSLASDFLNFLMTEQAQKIIMKHNYMFPVIQNIKTSPFSSLKIPSLISYRDLSHFLNQKKKLLKIWNDTLY